MSPATPADVLAQRRSVLLNGDVDGFADLSTTGRAFTATSIQIFRIRDGHIVLFRDFADTRGLEEVIGEPRHGS